jgi:hypothetical protein
MNSAMPEAFANGAFIGEHGSWNRNAFNGYKVVYVPFENGRPAGMAEDVVTGFLDGDQARGRPVGVAIDGTGALLVADDAGNTVWRVAAADGSVTTEPIGSDRQASGAGAEPVDEEAAGPDAVEETEAAEDDTPLTSPPATEADGESSSGTQSPESAGTEPPTPSQTEVAPAVLPEGTVEDGADQEGE